MPFVPRQLIGKVLPKSDSIALAVPVSKSSSMSFPSGGNPASKSAPPKRSEASVTAAAQLLERLERSGNDELEGADASKQESTTTVFERSERLPQEDSDDDVALGRWAAETTDEEDEQEFARERCNSEEPEADDCSRSAALREDLSPTPNGKASTPNRKDKRIEDEEDYDEDLEDAGPLPELSELRARALALDSGEVGRPPHVQSQSDRRREQQGCADEPMHNNEANSIRRVSITSTKGTAVNLMAVMGFCAKFGEVVAMQLEGSGNQARAVIEFRDASSAQACVKQRESELLHVVFCES